jgi:predicted ATPase
MDMFIERVVLYDKLELVENNAYPFSLPCVKNLDWSFKKPVTLLTGENGSGKSTIIEAIAVAYGMNAEGGSKNYKFSTVDTHSCLSKSLKLYRNGIPGYNFFLRAETFYNTISYEASTYDEKHPFSLDHLGNQYAGAAMHNMSHGESFYSLIAHLPEYGLYIMDEPEAALSPARQLSVVSVIRKLAKRGAQFIISTHSPFLLAIPDADIWQLGKEGMRQVAYEETEIYKMYKRFMDARDEMLVSYLGDTYKRSEDLMKKDRPADAVFNDIDHILTSVEDGQNTGPWNGQKDKEK